MLNQASYLDKISSVFSNDVTRMMRRSKNLKWEEDLSYIKSHLVYLKFVFVHCSGHAHNWTNIWSAQFSVSLFWPPCFLSGSVNKGFNEKTRFTSGRWFHRSDNDNALTEPKLLASIPACVEEKTDKEKGEDIRNSSNSKMCILACDVSVKKEIRITLFKVCLVMQIHYVMHMFYIL